MSNNKSNKIKNLLITLFIIIVIVIIILLLKSCDNGTKVVLINLNDNGYQSMQRLELKPNERKTLSVPSKEGYIFNGWIVESGDAVIEDNVFIMGKKESQIKALWSVETYTINYDLDGGTLENEVKNYTIETETFELGIPTKGDFVFTGWTGDKYSSPTVNITITKGSTGNKSFKANWESTGYDITYNLNGGSLGNKAIKKYTSSMDTFKLPIPTKSGYNFEGWYTDSEFNSEAETKIEKGSIGNKEYFAKWSIATYTINYNLNNGILLDEPVKNYTINSETFTLENPTKDYYEFTGWSGTGISKLSTNVIVKKGSYGNRKYEANYKPIEYNITYNLNGGTEGENTVKNYNVETDTFDLVHPSRIGYTFEGWYTDSEFNSEAETKIEKGNHEDKEYFAKWSLIEYTISYNLNGGSANIITSYNVETETFELVNPTKDYYEFTGWSGTDLDGLSKTVTIKKGSYGNKKYEANYKPIEYNITYNLNGGTEGENTVKNYNVETETFDLVHPSRTGYTFEGWYTDSEFNGDVETKVEKGNHEDKEYFAKWAIITYSINYSLNNGILIDEPVKNYTIDTETFTLENPTKDYYEFTGWSGTDLDGLSKTVTVTKGSYGNRTYEANYKPIEYNITYNLNGGAEGENTVKNYNVETDTFDLVHPSRIGYTFEGWYTDSEFNGDVETKIEKGNHEDKEYFAKWSLIEYTISYNLNGGSANIITSYNIETETFELVNPTKDYYEFTGWSGTDLDGLSKAVTVTKGSYGNRTYEANYEPIEYNITYNLNGGIEGENTVKNYNVETETFDLVHPSRTGYTFEGWYTNSEFNGDVETKVESGSYGDKEYFAKWSLITYSITYNLNGGTEGENTVKNYNVETETFDLVHPNRTGYTFEGWYTNSEFNGDVETKIEKGNHEDKEYFAKWSLITYSITYNLNGGTEGENTVKNYNIETETFDLVHPSRTGYTFEGWYTDSEFNGDVETKVESGSYGDKEYFAKWVPIEYSITYHTNEGTLPNSHRTKYTIENSFNLDVPKRTNYSFKGWYADSEFNGDVINKISSGTIGDKEYYAKWEAYKDYTGYEIYDMMKEGTPSDGEASLFVESEEGIDFSIGAGLTNGYGQYIVDSTKNDEYPIYYYRGDVDNNNIIVGNFCWKIVRTTEKGGTKLIYNGVAEDGKCTKTGIDTQIANKVKFNSTTSRFESIGYTYNGGHTMGSKASSTMANGVKFAHEAVYENGQYVLNDIYEKDDNFVANFDAALTTHHYTCLNSASSCTDVYYVYMAREQGSAPNITIGLYYIKLSGGDKIEDVLDNVYYNASNSTNSTIKAKIDTWYSSNMTAYTNLLEDTIFCNDRSVATKGGWDKDTSPTKKIGFGSTVRIEELGKPSLACLDPRDRFTVSTDNGNGILTYPVGLVTADEAAYSGFAWWYSDTFSYMNNGHLWWTMSPSRISASTVYIDVAYSMLDNVHSGYVTSSAVVAGGVRPSIALKSGTKIGGGKGTTEEPFILE